MVGRRASPSPAPDASGGRIDLPHLVLDPVWSLKPWPVVFDVAGQEYTIPAMCAADWLNVLMVDNLSADAVFPGLLDDDGQQTIEQLLHDELLDLEMVRELSLEIITQVAGRHWWVALRLVQVAKASWDALGGHMAMKADATRLTLSAWLDVLFMLILQNIEDSKRTMFLLKLEVAPEGWGDAPEQQEMSADAFLALAG